MSTEDRLLSKLESIEERLKSLEQKSPAQTAGNSFIESDESEEEEAGPSETMADLRHNVTLQRRVQRRLRALGVQPDSDSEEETALQSDRKGNSKKGKSGRAKTASDFIKVTIEWPHFHVFRGADRKPAQYDDLSMAEFVFGYLAIVQEGEHPSTVKRAMLLHLQGLMQDAAEYTFEGARNCHAIILQQLEQGRFTWTNTDKLLELRRTYAQRQTSDSAHQATRTGKDRPLFCLKFQEGTCTYTGEHQTNRGLVKHVCAYCLKQTGSSYNHPENLCRRKAKWNTGSKNGQD